MDSEDVLLKTVFTGTDYNELPNRLAELNLTTNDACQYLQQLSTLGLKKLGVELSRISEEKASIINQTQELAFQEYPTFIETAQCTQEIFQNFQNVNQSTEQLTAGLTTLKEKCLEFTQTAQSLSAARRLTSLALSRHTQLLEILELPQLMDTCVRNSYWEEALELASYVARLERRLGYIPLIVKVSQEVQSCTRLMLSQLIAQLRMPAQLPHCLKVVGYLRLMQVFSEEEIRLKFLQARDAWFKTTLEEIPKDDAYHHVLKTVELSRVHLFDIATQYRAIFTDEDPLVLANQNPNTNESAIYYSWIIQKITDFLGALQTDLPKISPSSLESVFGQCMYFGLSFGRIGSDFRSLLVSLFSQVVYDRFDRSTNKCEAQFAESMASFSLARTSIGSNVNSSLIQTQTSSVDQVHPPYALMKFSPLAELCNGLIAAFNELRMCAPVELVEPVARKLERTLSNCSQIMADFHRQEKEAFTTHEEEEYTKCLLLYRNEFVPYVQKIIQLMFPPALISVQTGFPTGEIVKQEVGCLDKDSILRPIVHLFSKEEAVIIPPLPELALTTSSAKTQPLDKETNPLALIEQVENPIETVSSNSTNESVKATDPTEEIQPLISEQNDSSDIAEQPQLSEVIQNGVTQNSVLVVLDEKSDEQPLALVDDEVTGSEIVNEDVKLEESQYVPEPEVTTQPVFQINSENGLGQETETVECLQETTDLPVPDESSQDEAIEEPSSTTEHEDLLS